MDRTFSPQPPVENSFDYQDDGPGYTTWNSHQYNLSRSPLNVTYSPGMDRTYSGTDHSYSSGGSYSPIGIRSPPRASTPQRGSPLMDRTFSPERSGTYGTYDNSDRTFSDRTYSGTDQSLSASIDDDNEYFQYFMDTEPYIDLKASLVDDAFEEGAYPMALRYGYSPGYGGYRHLTLDRGFYPAHLEAGAEDWDPLPLFHEYSPKPPDLKDIEKDPKKEFEVFWRRRHESTECPPYPRGFHSPVLSPGTPTWKKRLYADTATPSPQPLPRPAVGTVKLSPRTPIISTFSRYGYTDPDARIFNIPPGDDLVIPSGMQRAVAIVSPGRPDPLYLNVEVSPQSISQSPSGNHIICDIAIGVEEAVDQPSRNPFFTPPITETVRRYDRKHGMFTPRSIFKRGHKTIRNIFDVSPQTPTPRPSPADTSIEWEQDYLNRTFNATPSGAGLNTTFTRASPPGTQTMNRTFDASSSGAGLNTTFTRVSPPGTRMLNRTFDASATGAGLNTTFTRASPPGTQTLNRTFDASATGAGLNTTFTRASPPGTQILNRTFNASPSGAGLNTTFRSAYYPETN